MFILFSTLALGQTTIRLEAVVTSPHGSFTFNAQSFDIEVTSTYTGQPGSTGRSQFEPVVMRRTPDDLSQVLLERVALWSTPSTIRLSAFTPHASAPSGRLLLQEVELHDAYFSNMKTTLTASGAPVESLAMVAACMKVTSFTYDSTGVVQERTHAYDYIRGIESCD